MLFASRSRLLVGTMLRTSRSNVVRQFTIPAGVHHVDEATLTGDEYRKKHQIKVSNIDLRDTLYDPVASFDTCSLDKNVVKVLTRAGFTSPTATQAQSWPIAQAGRDIISVAKTGSGKTLGFLAPAFSKLMKESKKSRHPKIIVLAPTRELCLQIQREAENFSSIGIRSVATYGGASRTIQMNAIRKGVDAVVATPGRLNDFLEYGVINVSEVEYVVLDEADRMLDMGFEPQIRQILNDCPKTKQLLLFTATWPKEVRALADSYLNNPVHINIGQDDGLNANKAITQNFIYIDRPRGFVKQEALFELLKKLRASNEDPKSVPKTIIFMSRKSDCDFMEEELYREGYAATAIHGDKSQAARDGIMGNFRRGRTRILVATDVAARGLDINDVEVVINFEFPSSGVEDYIHRIGRTARGTRTGVSYTFFQESDRDHARELVEVLKKSGQEVPEEIEALIPRQQMPQRSNNKRRYGSVGDTSGSRYGTSKRDLDGGRGGRGFDDRSSGRQSFDRYSSSRGGGDRYSSGRGGGDRYSGGRSGGSFGRKNEYDDSYDSYSEKPSRESRPYSRGSETPRPRPRSSTSDPSDDFDEDILQRRRTLRDWSA